MNNVLGLKVMLESETKETGDKQTALVDLLHDLFAAYNNKTKAIMNDCVHNKILDVANDLVNLSKSIK